MPDSPPLDLELAHRWFSADCFNRTWAYLDQAERSDEDRETMLSLAHASLAHWRDRPDATPQNFAIGYWLLSRVYAVLEIPAPALRYGRKSLELSEGVSPFCLAYGHEAIARGSRVAGNEADHLTHLELARALVPQIDDPEDRALLEADLDELAG